jgi:RimJ/RimL family protein N-acetyltransferase
VRASPGRPGPAARAAALRTPPSLLLCTDLAPGDGEELLSVWREADPDLPGAAGPPGAVRALAAAWSAQTGGGTRLIAREALLVAEAIRDPPDPGPGRLRVARASERDWLVEWMAAFLTESAAGPPARAPASIDGFLSFGGLHIWEDRGRAVCLVGVNLAVAGVRRIGPVYTPPDCRRRGYASAAVAAASRGALASGAHTCVLFTDLDNPTSNHIYGQLGYRRRADWVQRRFDPGPGGAENPRLHCSRL